MGWYEENITTVELTLIPIMTVVIALVMISTISYPSLKKWKLETVKPWTFAFIIIVIFLLFYAAEIFALALLTLYLLWGIAQALTKKSFERIKKSKQPSTQKPTQTIRNEGENK
jgi:phosphatidylserine synthase